MRDKYKNRAIFIRIFIAVVAVILIAQLINLQLVKNYREQSLMNAVYVKTSYAPRGLIYDRNDKLLVFNQPVYDIAITMKTLNSLQKNGTPIDTNSLCNALNISKENFISKLENIKDKRKNPYYSPLVPQILLTQLSPSDAFALKEILWQFKGIFLIERTMRQYSYPNAAHALGSIGEVSKEILAKYDTIYKQGDYVGLSGVEKQYEEALRGENGKEYILRGAKGDVFDERGNAINGRYKNGELDKSPTIGKTLKITLDIDLQAYGELLMKNKVGSIAAIDPETGEILALVSSPSFSPDTLVGTKRSANYLKLLNDPYRPLLDRPLMARYPPGSTFKTVNALVFEHEGIIDKNTRYPCHAGYVIGSFRVACHNHSSPLDLSNSISNSCNAYYCAALRAMLDNKKYGNIQNAFNQWREDILSFGFGKKLGIDFPNENNGGIPKTERYDKVFGKKWKSLNVVSLSIGQGEIIVTPIQLANLAATIANRGFWVRPHILKEMEGAPLDTMYTNKQYTVVEPEYFEPIVQGMEWAVNGGGSGSTARIANLNDIGVTVCGKTGTAENPHGGNHSIFMAFAPKDNPKIAIAIVVENAGFGATWAAPIVSLMIEKYLKGSIADNRKWQEERIV
ncbi:MAG: penicillin-binding protein 2, partial [Prevotellaceae bacterium]|nr:penicillin-binding protein 2 [Prevotellaceae bacterium]